MTRSKRAVVLVSSGLGARNGGIGVVSAGLARALGPDRVVLWRHHHRWPGLLRRGALAARATLGVLARPALILYEHVGLASLHAALPWLAPLPYAVFLHGTEVWRSLGPRQRRALDGAAVLLANSATTERQARRHNPWLPPVAVVYLGVPIGPPGVPAGLRPPVALMLGRMASAERYKGHEEVLRAWPLIRAAVPGAELEIAGDGDDRARLVEAARGLPGVTFVGWLSDEERARCLSTARLLLQPSRGEGFGLVTLEAAAAGTAVLGLKGTVLEELLPEGGAALSKDLSPEALAAAAIPVLRDAAVASCLGQAARREVEARFGEEQFHARVRAALAEWAA